MPIFLFRDSELTFTEPELPRHALLMANVSLEI